MNYLIFNNNNKLLYALIVVLFVNSIIIITNIKLLFYQKVSITKLSTKNADESANLQINNQISPNVLIVFANTTNLKVTATQTKSQSLNLSTIAHQNSTALNFDEYCDKFGEWEAIDSNVFIKKSAVFYFVEAQLLRVHILRRGSVKQSFGLEVLFLNQANSDNGNKKSTHSTVYFNATNLYHATSSSKYYYNVIQVNLTLSDYNIKVDRLADFEIKVKVSELESGHSTLSYLDVKIKHIKGDFAKKKGSIVCAKCFYLTKVGGYLPLKWWLELNRRTGHNNVFMCDHAIEKHDAFDKLFEQYKDFVFLDKLKCLPNLQALPKFVKYKYLKRYDQLEYMGTGKYDVTKYEVIMQLIQNECYSNYIDQYKYVAAYDSDEVILSRLTSNFSSLQGLAQLVLNMDNAPANMLTNNLESETKTSISLEAVTQNIKCDRQPSDHLTDKFHSFEDFFDELAKQVAVTRPVAHFFNHGYFLDNNFVSSMFGEFERVLTRVNITGPLNDDASYNISINVTDTDRQKGPVSFLFTIRTRREYHYALNLLKIYKFAVGPFLEKHKKVVADGAHIFDRLFAIIGHVNDFALGKTLHDTRLTLDFHIHLMESYFDMTKDQTRVNVVFDRHYRNYNYMPYNLTHLSHFRTQQYFDYKSLSVQNLYIDLNYLNCYFIPILEDFTSQRLF